MSKLSEATTASAIDRSLNRVSIEDSDGASGVHHADPNPTEPLNLRLQQCGSWKHSFELPRHVSISSFTAQTKRRHLRLEMPSIDSVRGVRKDITFQPQGFHTLKQPELGGCSEMRGS